MIEHVIKNDASSFLSGGVSSSFSVQIKDQILEVPSDVIEISKAQNKLDGTFRLMDGKIFRIVNEKPSELGLLKLIGLNNGNNTSDILSESGTH